jgi:hypothetical protein
MAMYIDPWNTLPGLPSIFPRWVMSEMRWTIKMRGRLLFLPKAGWGAIWDCSTARVWFCRGYPKIAFSRRERESTPLEKCHSVDWKKVRINYQHKLDVLFSDKPRYQPQSGSTCMFNVLQYESNIYFIPGKRLSTIFVVSILRVGQRGGKSNIGVYLNVEIIDYTRCCHVIPKKIGATKIQFFIFPILIWLVVWNIVYFPQ